MQRHFQNGVRHADTDGALNSAGIAGAGAADALIATGEPECDAVRDPGAPQIRQRDVAAAEDFRVPVAE